MKVGKSQIAATRDAEAARIARWFRETEYGLAFLDAEGRALPISQHERERWERRAHRELDRFLREYEHAPTITIVGLAIAAVVYTLVSSLFAALMPPLPGALLGVCCLPTCLWPLVVELRYRRRLASLRVEIAERMPLRVALPEKTARAAYRTNIFMTGAQIMTVVLIGFGVSGAWRGNEAIEPLMLLPAAAAAALVWAGRRVDAKHRRSAW